MPSRNSIPYRVNLLEGYVGGGVVITGTSTPTLSVTGASSISGSNTGDNATNTQYSGLAASKENTANKQNSLAIDGTGAKFPTVDAVNDEFSAISTDTSLLKSTGILTGGVISIGSGGAGVATTFSITAGTGTVVDNTVNPTTVTDVTWTVKTNVAVTNILTQLVTFIAIDSGGNVIQSATDFTPSQMRQYIVIGVVVHSNLTTVNAVNQAQIVAYNQGNQLSDLFYSIGLFNVSGNIFTANGANLKLNKSVGSLFRRGANYTSLTNNPHLVTNASLTQVPLRMQNQTGAGSASTTDIDVANYDVAGVTTLISPSTRFSVLRVYLFQSNLVAVQRGQATYLSLAEAKAAIQTETFVTNGVLAANGLLRGFIVAQANATSLSDATKVFFIESGKFGSSSGVGGLSVSTLQNAYDNSSTPEITTDATRGGVTVKEGTGTATNQTFEALDNSSNIVWQTTGQGMRLRQCTEAVRDALTSVPTGLMIYNTDKDRSEFYEPYWGWHPLALTPSAMRDWGVEFIEDFHQSTPSYIWSGAAINGGAISALAGYFGLNTMSTATNTNGGFQLRGSIAPIQFGGGQYRWDSRLRIPTNSTGAETFQFLCGFWDTNTSVNQVDGIYFLYDSQGVSTGSAASGNWQIVTVSNSVRTFTTTSVAIDNTNLQKLRIDINALATSVTFYIDNVSVGTHITNIPSGASRIAGSGVYLQKSAGTTARTADVDYLYLKAKFTTPR
tara:strand:- start:540 stop:2723 length:2184 start_codon:yes stop_codon:yes gene_type:complete